MHHTHQKYKQVEDALLRSVVLCSFVLVVAVVLLLLVVLLVLLLLVTIILFLFSRPLFVGLLLFVVVRSHH
jgi:hypothetical protein